MKKQDNESLIQEIQKRLDWYTMEASDEEFDADEVQNLLKLLDSLTPEEEKDRLSSDEVVDNFWKYCAEREEEERILAEADETEKKKEHKVLHNFPILYWMIPVKLSSLFPLHSYPSTRRTRHASRHLPPSARSLPA